MSLILLAWLVSAAIRAPVVPIWPTTLTHYRMALALMIPASVLLVGGALAANPLLVSFRRQGYDPGTPGIVGLTRHPIFWGFALWALAHLVANGDMVSLILFGGFALFSLHGMRIVDRRKRRELGSRWPLLAEPTAALPFLAWLTEPVARRWKPPHLIATLGGGAILYRLLL